MEKHVLLTVQIDEEFVNQMKHDIHVRHWSRFGGPGRRIRGI